MIRQEHQFSTVVLLVLSSVVSCRDRLPGPSSSERLDIPVSSGLPRSAEHRDITASRDLLCSIRQGMTEHEVLSTLGKPDEIRTKGDLGIVAEKYRWVYGIGNSGEFPHIGAVIFGADNTVFMTYCPSRSLDKRCYVSMPFSEEPQSTPSGMHCEIDRVFIDSRFNTHYVRVSLVNEGGWDFRFPHDRTGIRFQLVLELYDNEKKLILQEPIFGYDSGCGERPEWPVMVVPPGGRISEDVPIWWRDVNDGVLGPGTYYVRVGFPFETGKYYASNLAEWQLPSGLSRSR